MDPLSDTNMMEDDASLTQPHDIDDQGNDQQRKPTTRSSDENTILQQVLRPAREGNMHKARPHRKQLFSINRLDSDGSPALHLVVKSVNAEVVSLLLEYGVDIHAKRHHQETDLHYAAGLGNLKGVSLLLDYGADIHAKDNGQKAVLHYAAESENPEVVSLLLEYGADIHAKDKDQRTALHFAARYTSPEVVSLLLEHGAYIHAKDRDLWTALHYAATSKSSEVTSLLLEHGADVHAKDAFQKTALHYAASYGIPKGVSLLLEYGADTHAKDKTQQTILHYAAQSRRPKVVSLLLDYGADINAKGDDQKTVLHIATAIRSLEMVSLLLNSGANVNATDFNGSTALHLAIASKDVAVALALLDGGSRADVIDDSKLSPLRIALRHSFFELIPALVRNGANINEQSQNGSTVLLEAAERGDTYLVSALLEIGASTEIANNNALTPLFVAANNGYLGVISLLLSHGANKHTTDHHLRTVLHRAAERGDWNVASTLLKGGLDTEEKNGDGDTALHIAAQFNHLSIVIKLCQHNANINATDHHGLTVLHRAVWFGRKEIVSYLMDAGAKFGNSDDGIDTLLYVAAQAGQAEIAEVALSSRFYTVQAAMDNSRQFSLFRAAECGHTDVVNVLLQHGVDMESTDEKGWTALHKACYASKLETVRTLIHQGANKEAKEKENERTCLFLAANDPKIILLLIAEGADIEARTHDGATALHYYASIGQLDAIHLLLNYGCNIESRDYRGQTALHYAAEHNQAETMRFLLDNGLDPYIENSIGYNAFHQAAQTTSEEAMKVLLDNGFNIDTKAGQYNITALLYALKSMSLRVIEFLLDHGANVNTIDTWDRTSLHYAVKRDDLKITEVLLNRGVAVNALDRSGKSAFDYAVEADKLPIVALLARSGANFMKSTQPRKWKVAHYLRHVVRPIEQTAAKELFNASTLMRPEEEDMMLPFDWQLQEIFVILNEENQIYTTERPLGGILYPQYSNRYLAWWKKLQIEYWQDKITAEQPSAYPSYGSRTDGYIERPKELEAVLGSSTDNWAIRVIACLLKTEDISLYANDQVFALKLNTDTYEAAPKWAFHFNKMKGVIREPGFLIVQIPEKRTSFSEPGWFDHDNALLRFIDAIYVCRRVSEGIDPDAFSEVLGGQEQRLSTKLHATLVAALGIASITGGPHIVHRIVDAVLKCGPDYAPPAPAWPWKDWQALNRVRCPCECDVTHGPLTPVAAAKAIGINVWKERKRQILPRVWDIERDQLVKRVDVTDVMFITHHWDDPEIEYEDMAMPTYSSPKKISRQSSKLKRIRDTLRLYTQYVWLDTICIDKSNLSELDETIRSMYAWYGNCRAVVLDCGTTLDVWRKRGWCLQEGAAAGTLYGMSDGGELVSIQSLAKAQKIYLCKLDLSLYYRRGNAVEIISRMDIRETSRVEDMAYALVGIFSIHLTLAYGEQSRARDRLLGELATQEGDISTLSFLTPRKNTGRYLPTVGDKTFRIAQCHEASSPTILSHIGLSMEARLINAPDFEQVMSRLASLKLLKTYSEGRYVAVDKLIDAADSAQSQEPKTIYLAIIDEISSIMLIEEHGKDVQTAHSDSIKCFSRLQCCQLERDEFGRLFSSIRVPYERIWLGNQPANGQRVGSKRKFAQAFDPKYCPMSHLMRK